MPAPKHVRVFISSPAEVDPERKIVDRVVARLGGVWKSHVELTAKNWVREDYEAVRSFQESMGQMKEFDVVIGILWKRIGSPLRPDMFRRADGTGYESGTVYEIETALASGGENGKPTVYLFKKTAKVTYTAENVDEDRRQHLALEAWWDRTVNDDSGHNLRGHALFAELDEFEERIAHLLERYLRDRQLIPAGAAWDIATKGSPYPGLLAYDREFEAVFFGRNLAITAALEDLRAAARRGAPALFIVGPSGSGKSSLARAGLLPRFVDDGIEGVDVWRQAILEPTEDPFLTLGRHLYARALPKLAESSHPTPEDFAALARQAPDAAAQTVKWALDALAKPDDARRGGARPLVCRLVLVVDQLEIILDGPQSRAITQFVRALVDNESSWVIATLRSDRYPALQRDPDLLELRRRGALYDLPPPGPSELDDIIKGPARAANLEFEDCAGQSLVKIISAAVGGADALPLLQMTLWHLFNARDNNRLTCTAYEEMGGLGGAIAAHAQEVFDNASPAAQATLDALLGALVTDIDKDGTLTIRTLDRAGIAGPAVELVTKLIEARLLVNTDGGIRIAHEALLRRWERASESPALQSETIRLRRQVERSLEIWQRTQRDSDLLPAETTLLFDADIVVRKYPGAFPADLEDYVWRSIRASEARAKEAQRRAEADASTARRRALGAMIAAVAFAVIAVVALITYQRAQDNFSLALLSNAEQFLREEKPTRALALARNAVGGGLLANLIRKLPFSSANIDEDVIAGSIARIAAPASSMPGRTVKLPYSAEAVAFAPNGKQFAIGGGNGEVFVEDVDGGGEIPLPGHTAQVTSVRFSPDGKRVASASYDDSVRLWDLGTRHAIVLCGHSSRVNDISFDPKGRYLASASNDGSVIVWDLTNFRQFKRFDRGASTRWALAVDFSNDGSKLAFSYDDGSVFLQNTADWTVTEIKTGLSDVVSIALSPDGTRIAVASIEGDFDIWDVATVKRIAQISEHRDKLWKLRFSPDGRFLASASWDGTARLWNSSTFRYIGGFDGNDQWVTDIAFSPDSTLLATADEAGAVRIWARGEIQPMFQVIHDDSRETLTGKYNRDGTKFVTGGRDRLARLYSIDAQGNLTLLCAVAHDDWVYSLAYLDGDKSVVSAGTAEGKSDNVIKIWNADDHCTPQHVIPIKDAFVETLAASQDGRHLAWASRRGDVVLVDASAGMQQTILPNPPSGTVYSLAFSPDGKYLAASGQSGVIVVWSVDTRKIYREMPKQADVVEAVVFAPNGDMLASAGGDGLVQIWNIFADQPLVTSLAMRGGANTVAFDKDGTFLAVGGDERVLAIWSVANWSKRFELDGLVGVRGVFGVKPTDGSLAFDGENGLVRVLAHPMQQQTVMPAVAAKLQGTEILFDQLPPTVSADAPAARIDSRNPGCQAPSGAKVTTRGDDPAAAQQRVNP